MIKKSEKERCPEGHRLAGAHPQAVLALAIGGSATVFDDEVDRCPRQVPVFLHRAETLAVREEHVEVAIFRASPEVSQSVKTETLYLVVADALVFGGVALYAPLPRTLRHAIDTAVQGSQQQAAVGALRHAVHLKVAHPMGRIHPERVQADDAAVGSAHHGSSRTANPEIVVAVLE